MCTYVNFTRAVASGGRRGGARGAGAPWTCWARHIKSVDGVVFFRLSYFDNSDLQLFAIFRFEVDFSETYFMTSAKNSVSEPQNLKVFSGKDTPRPAETHLIEVCLVTLTVKSVCEREKEKRKLGLYMLLPFLSPLKQESDTCRGDLTVPPPPEKFDRTLCSYVTLDY